MDSSILSCIGNTPLVKLNFFSEELREYGTEIWVKLENRNPGGSIKDRAAYAMIADALKKGALKKCGTIIEPTSGNTGIALAMVAASMGIKCCIVMPDSMSLERRMLIQAYGASLELTPAAEGMQGAIKRAEALCKGVPDAFMPQQFENPCAASVHYDTTGPEIFAKTQQNLHAFVAAFGTGGTVSGVGLYLKEQIPHLKVYGVEPSESPLLSQGHVGTHGIQGIGANFIPSILRQDVLDAVETVSTDEAMRTARDICVREGICCGITSGANVCAALRVAKLPEMRGKRVVTFVCDTGERYLSTQLFQGDV